MSEVSDKTKAVFAKDKWILLLSLFLAVVSWYTIREIISFESSLRNVRVIVLVDEGWAVLDQDPETVAILFRGPQEDIRALTQEKVEVIVDMRGQALDGVATVPLDPSMVNVSGSARAVSFSPDELTLELDREIEKQLPVKVDMQGRLPVGYELEQVVCQPVSVVVGGPRQKVEKLEVIRTVPLDLNGRLQSFDRKVSLVPPEGTWDARLAPDRVTVEVKIVERAAEKTFTDVPVQIMLPPGVGALGDAGPQFVEIVIRGRSEDVDMLDMSSVHAFVVCSDLDPSVSYELPVKVFVSGRISVESVSPASVKVTLKEF
ncbi:MAG: hypothetical protein KJ626_11160 [Verrucomicrobia bacterium]|nr:hypothetical protein [Verrucomicrobiota bacterium]